MDMRILFTLSFLFFTFASHAIYKGVEEKDLNGIRNIMVQGHFDNKPSCTGTLIAPDIIATTAWCAFASKQMKWYYLGKSGVKQTLNVLDAIIHPDFDPAKFSWGSKYVALLKIAKPLPNPYGDLYKSIPEQAIELNETVTIAGFGRTENENAQSAGVLRSTAIVVDSKMVPNIDSMQFLTGKIVENTAPIPSACRGDWGGPVIGKKDNNHILYGMIVSNAPPKDTVPQTCGGQTYYIHYGPIKKWIELTVEVLRKRKTI